MNEKILEEYVILDAQIKHLTNQKDELKVEIIKDLVKSEYKSIVTAIGKFTLTPLKTWTYTPKVAELEEKFKAQKAMEQSTGDATYEEKPSLRFTPVKF